MTSMSAGGGMRIVFDSSKSSNRREVLPVEVDVDLSCDDN
jgi:hypothetical protein